MDVNLCFCFELFPVQRFFSTGKWISSQSLSLFLTFKTEISGMSVRTIGSVACDSMYIVFPMNISYEQLWCSNTLLKLFLKSRTKCEHYSD